MVDIELSEIEPHGDHVNQWIIRGKIIAGPATKEEARDMYIRMYENPSEPIDA